MKSENDWAMCLDCDWQGNKSDCDEDDDYDEFWGGSYNYPICPKCGGAVEYGEYDIDDDKESLN